MRACIAGWGTALPEQRLTNADLERRVDTSDQWIVERTGIRERRVVAPGESTASLAIEAGAAAIKHAGITPDAIDLLIVATATPEQLIPHTGAFVADGLGINCGSFDINAGCAGFVYELVVGSSMLAAGNLQHVLVVGAETLSRFVDPFDRATCILFGDAAAAFVLSASPDDGPGILAWELGCDGSATGLLALPAGGSRLPTTLETVENGEHFIKMVGPEVFRRAVRIVIESATTALDRSGVSVADITWFAPHQANIRIIEAAANRLGIAPERTLVNIDHYGNTSAASIPLVLAEAADAGRIDDGDLVLISGFGAGLTWGSAVLRWGRGVTSARTAFVTGGSRGIGRACAVALAEAGHRVAFCYSSDDDGAKETQAAVEEAGGDALPIQASVADAAAVDRAFGEIEETFGPVELLVNNAGITADGLVMRMTDDQWDSVLTTNLTGAFHTIRRATPKMMRARFGRIVNVSSVSGQSGQPGQANYAAAKAGLVGLSRSVARELASRGITCNIVAPGPIVTGMTDALPDDWRAWATETVPLGRLGDPFEVGAVVAFLCSDPAGYVTGALVPVDGGLGMGH